jgi:malyl-CoA/(S)-citramalyl-CoA lyase
MRSPGDFFKPLAVEAPEPLRDIPFKPSRMIHFLDLSNEKMAAKAPEIASATDILLGISRTPCPSTARRRRPRG